jgi:tetratricopeptide (TPR) repeat protein
MKKANAYQILALILCPLIAFSQVTDNAELKKMYKEDQESRQRMIIDWVQLGKNDSLREIRIYELIKSGQVVTGTDYYNSAMIFQHGRDSIAYGMAVKQMRKAIELDTTIDKWLLAAAIDRALMSRGKPQIYGTQYTRMNGSKWSRYDIDTTQVTDAERKYYRVESLEEQKTKEFTMNLTPISEFYSQSASIDKTIEFIKSEKKKGSASGYNVSENGINKFAYSILKSKTPADALPIFILNTELYPSGFNAFDSLGECLMALNKKKEAIEAYKQSLKLNPANKNAQKIIDETK